ncbi:hypothetical protein LZ32DRAFT_330921 [Colletotrichum eremochloae]|nr:hypothetical protein LZ32DRAFT_330921 [Colletotrichum eremochloae]
MTKARVWSNCSWRLSGVFEATGVARTQNSAAPVPVSPPSSSPSPFTLHSWADERWCASNRSDVSVAVIGAAYCCPWLITRQITANCVSCRCAISGLLSPPSPSTPNGGNGRMSRRVPCKEKKRRGPSFDLSFLRAFAAPSNYKWNTDILIIKIINEEEKNPYKTPEIHGARQP